MLGVDPARFGLPPSTALRYEIPAPDLAGLVADYHVLDSIPLPDRRPTERMLPNGPALRFILAARPMALAIGEGEARLLPHAAFYGATSMAAEMATGGGGITVGVNMTPAGVARLTKTVAHEMRDRVVPLETVIEPKVVARLMGRLRESDAGPQVKAILDDTLRTLLSCPHSNEPSILRIASLLATPGISTVTEACDRLGMNQRRLERLVKQHFGFSPKLLFRRARLLRSIVALKLAGPPFDLTLIDPDYHDHSHFAKDARRFLGMAPMRFLRLPTPYLDATLRARSIVRGAAVAALDRETSAS